jgi:group I intron endonuclease
MSKSPRSLPLSSVYGIFNLAEDRVYVGSSLNTRTRWGRWLEYFLHPIDPTEEKPGRPIPNGGRRVIKKDFIRLGAANFVFVVLEKIDPNNTKRRWEREQYWMDQFPSKYNLAIAGRGAIPTREFREFQKATAVGRPQTPEARAKVSKAHKGRIYRPISRLMMATASMDKIISKETRAKMSASRMGHLVSEETRAKLSKMFKGRVISKSARLKMSRSHKGLKPSLETRARMSKSQTERRKLKAGEDTD